MNNYELRMTCQDPKKPTMVIGSTWKKLQRMVGDALRIFNTCGLIVPTLYLLVHFLCLPKENEPKERALFHRCCHAVRGTAATG